MRSLLIYIVFLFFHSAIYGQQKYWIYFNDLEQSISENSELNDETVCLNHHLDLLHTEGVEPVVKSYWLNAISTILSEHEVKRVKGLSYVKDITPVNRNLKIMSGANSEPPTFSRVLDQIQADTLIHLRLNGEGLKIGIIDGGFLEADKKQALNGIIENDRVVAYKNYIEKDITNPYNGSRTNQDDHGTKVWQAIGGVDENKRYRGMATQSSYYLARTDQGDREYRGEEDYWVEALEWMYAQGVRLVNSSVGYSIGYDDPGENYSIDQVDGESSAITKAATIAAEEKGMLIVISAGNDGDNYFKVISIPADAKGILSVGATTYNSWSKAGYSAIGPEHLPQVKPEVACYSSSGTSFSAPVITGLAACVWQAYPELTNQEVIDYIQKSAHLSHAPNNYLGYGVPDTKRLFKLLDGQANSLKFKQKEVDGSVASLRLAEERNIVAFHKKDEHIVIKQEVLRKKRNEILVYRYENAERTTVATPNEVVEIFWKD